MKSIRQNHTALYFFVTSFCTLLYALSILIGAGNKNILIPFLGNDLVIDKFELAILFKVALLVLSVGYFVAERLRMPLVATLTQLHVAFTIGCILLSAVVAFVLPDGIVEQTCFWLIIIALAAQLLFVINIVAGVIKHRRLLLTQEV